MALVFQSSLEYSSSAMCDICKIGKQGHGKIAVVGNHILKYTRTSSLNMERQESKRFYAEVHIHSHAFHASLAGGVFSHIHPIFTSSKFGL